MLITISGIDCSGKTTQIELLDEALSARGVSVGNLWYRPGYSPELDAVRAWARRLAPQQLPSAGPSRKREQLFARPGVSRTWIAVALVDMLLQYALKLRALLTRYDVVICDRYLEDAALDFALRFPDAGIEESVAFELVRQLSPRPHVSFLLMISREEMLRRMDEKREPFPDPPEVRDSRFDRYIRMARSDRLQTIDASQPIERVHADILGRLDDVNSAERG